MTVLGAVQHHAWSPGCGGSHCWSHAVDEDGTVAYRSCGECGHVWRTPADLLADVLALHEAVAAGNGEPVFPPPTDAGLVATCPLCCHDF